jgi:hypothetical protein
MFVHHAYSCIYFLTDLRCTNAYLDFGSLLQSILESWSHVPGSLGSLDPKCGDYEFGNTKHTHLNTPNHLYTVSTQTFGNASWSALPERAHEAHQKRRVGNFLGDFYEESGAVHSVWALPTIREVRSPFRSERARTCVRWEDRHLGKVVEGRRNCWEERTLNSLRLSRISHWVRGENPPDRDRVLYHAECLYSNRLCGFVSGVVARAWDLLSHSVGQ